MGFRLGAHEYPLPPVQLAGQLSRFDGLGLGRQHLHSGVGLADELVVGLVGEIVLELLQLGFAVASRGGSLGLFLVFALVEGRNRPPLGVESEDLDLALKRFENLGIDRRHRRDELHDHVPLRRLRRRQIPLIEGCELEAPPRVAIVLVRHLLLALSKRAGRVGRQSTDREQREKRPRRGTRTQEYQTHGSAYPPSNGWEAPAPRRARSTPRRVTDEAPDMSIHRHRSGKRPGTIIPAPGNATNEVSLGWAIGDADPGKPPYDARHQDYAGKIKGIGPEILATAETPTRKLAIGRSSRRESSNALPHRRVERQRF